MKSFIFGWGDVLTVLRGDDGGCLVELSRLACGSRTVLASCCAGGGGLSWHPKEKRGQASYRWTWTPSDIAVAREQQRVATRWHGEPALSRSLVEMERNYADRFRGADVCTLAWALSESGRGGQSWPEHLLAVELSPRPRIPERKHVISPGHQRHDARENMSLCPRAAHSDAVGPRSSRRALQVAECSLRLLSRRAQPRAWKTISAVDMTCVAVGRVCLGLVAGRGVDGRSTTDISLTSGEVLFS